MNNNEYKRYISENSKPSPCLKNCIKAFLTGGTICLFGELISNLILTFGVTKETSLMLTSCIIIFIAGLLTGIGVFDKIAKFGGGGALVPITGFANAMTAPAIEAKSEGFITGVATKIFSIAGPVITYGTAASVIYGIIYYVYGVLN